MTTKCVADRSARILWWGLSERLRHTRKDRMKKAGRRGREVYGSVG